MTRCPNCGHYWLQWGRRLSSTETPARARGDARARGFNGAADFRRRRRRVVPRCASERRRFNGAADFRRRRPSGTLASRSCSVWLQWGRRLSSTETVGAGGEDFVIVELQWGRRLSSTETQQQGPGFNLGERASMGPPTFVDGDVTQLWNGALVPPLQWGRRLSSTETLVSAFGTSIDLELQWGRRLSSTETRRRCWRRRRRRWLLQWGRRLSSTETLPRWVSVMEVLPLQWGRRLSSTETTSQRGTLSLPNPASMGPPTFVDGDARRRPALGAGPIASMGPPTFVDGDSRG